MQWGRCVFVLAAFWMSHGVICGQDTLGHHREIAAQILRSWRQRQESTRELTFAWTSEDYHLYSPAEFQAQMTRAFRGEQRQEMRESDELSTSWGWIAYGVGDQIRMDAGSTAEGTSAISEADSDGAVTVFFPHGSRGYQRASIMEHRRAGAHVSLYALPMRLIFRPFLENAGFDGIEKAQCTQTGLVSEGTRCDVLTWELFEVWVSADEQRLPVRYRRSARLTGALTTDITIVYNSDERDLPVPVGWKINIFGDDGETILQSHDVLLTEVDLVAPPAPETFKIEFPHGTFVRNRATDENYIVRDGMPNRIVREGEFTGDNYDQLLSSDMPITPQEIATKSTVNWIWVGNGLIIAIILFLLYRRHVQT